MVDPTTLNALATNLTNVAVTYTSQQISDLLVERAFGFIISFSLTAIGIGIGAKARNQIAKIIGIIIALIGAIGDMVFLLGLLDIFHLLLQTT